MTGREEPNGDSGGIAEPEAHEPALRLSAKALRRGAPELTAEEIEAAEAEAMAWARLANSC
jgi:hypothetical protein